MNLGLARVLASRLRQAGALIDLPAASVPTRPLEGVLGDALRLALQAVGERRIDVVTDVPSGLHVPGCSAGAWRALLMELVDNSVRHGFSGRPGGRIELGASRWRPGVLRVVYSDDGVGLGAVAREHAFRRPCGSDAATRAGGQGVGLGLGLCGLRDIVHRQLSGAIFLLEVPVGTAFAIDVPAADRGPAGSPPGGSAR